jgi:hypothetical protein
MTVGPIRRAAVRLAVSSLMVGFAACASPGMTRSDVPIAWTHETKRVALVMSDIQLVQYSSQAPGEGTFALRTDWTLAAQGFIAKSVAGHLAKSGIAVVTVDELTNTSVRPVNQRLTEARHDCEGGPSLMMTELKDRLMADYALVICAHDTYTSAGAAISDLFLGTLFTAGLIFVFEGSPTPNGELIASAMLVDLKNGETVWSNSYTANSGGMRTERGAQTVVTRLIGQSPL